MARRATFLPHSRSTARPQPEDSRETRTGTRADRAARNAANVRAGIFFVVLISVVTLALHYPLLSMPFYWDELGQFVPAALDIFEKGAWVPVSTLPNIHPPGLMALLAGVWQLAGYSIEVTRVTMLLLASLGVFLAFRLTLQLAAGVPGLPGFSTVLLLFASPLFYSQAMMAQLDMPAMVLTLLALSLFLDERLILSAVACIALVWVKETGVILPLVVGLFLWWEGRRQEALLFAVPCAALAPWLWLLWSHTGSVFGNREFAEYNVLYPLHPARLGLALLRRFYELCINHGYLLGAIPIAMLWRRRAVFARREWRLIYWFVLAHVVAVTVAGGAVLERYLLPVIPLCFAGFAIAWCELGGRKAIVFPLATALLSGFGFFLPPLFPQPEENDLEMTRSVELYQIAARWLSKEHAHDSVATTWPLSDALSRPRMGYVETPLKVFRVPSLDTETLKRVAAKKPDAFVLYSNDEFEDSWIRLRFPIIDDLRSALYQWEPAVMGRDVEDILGMREEARWQVGQSSIAVFSRREVWNDGRRRAFPAAQTVALSLEPAERTSR